MIFKVNIGTLTNTVNGYGNTSEILVEQNNKVNSAIKELTDLGWSGKAKDEFLKAHEIRQKKYIQFEKKIKFVRDIMQDIEKTKAVDLKTLCENFVNHIERIGQGGALTGSDVGTISFNGEPTPINRNVDNCINDDYNKISSNMNKIMDIVDSLEYTSFGIGKHISSEVETSIKNQTTSLTDFKDVFNTYYNRVRDLESSICSAFQHVSGVNEGSFKSSSVISPSGEIAEDKVLEIMSKNPKDLTTAEKEILQYANTILGKDKYLKDYNEIIGKKVNDLMLKNPSKVTEDESYYLETIKGIIGEDKYTKLRESIGNPLPPSMRPTEYNKSPYSITINITEDDMNAFILATETNPYTAPVGIGLEEIPVGAKYLKSVLSKFSAIGKEEEIVADVSKTISEGGKISETGYMKSSELSSANSEEMAKIGAPIGHIGYPKDIVLHESPYSVAADLSNVTGKGAEARNKAIEAIMNEDLKDINFSVTPKYNPFLTTGISDVSDGSISQIGKMKFSNRNDLIDTILHEELHIRLKTDGVYGQEYNSVLYHHPPRGVIADSEEFGEFVKVWQKNPTEEMYKTILQKAKDTNKWWR